MDRSTRSLPAGSRTRDSSPSSGKGKLVSPELESNLSALGHVGIVKYQRDALRVELGHERLQKERQRQAAASLRRLTLRLAAQVSVKEARVISNAQALSRSRATHYASSREKDGVITQLQSGLLEYQRQAQELYKILSDGGASLAKGKDYTAKLCIRWTH
jgi:hypothetical protein